MANEFVARNGLISQNNSVVTGSLTITQGIIGSLLGTSSWAENALTASYVEIAQTASYVLGGASIDTGSLLTTASVSLNTITFTKGDGSTFPITVDTGSAGGSDNFKYVKGNSISFLESNITLAIRTFLLDEIIYYPIYIRQSLDITHAQLQVTSTAGASSETIIGLYDNGVSGTPTNLLGSVIINTTSNSIFSTAFASPISVTPGTYWVATNTNISYAAYCLRSAAVGGLQNNLINVVSSDTGGGLDLYERYRQSYTYDGSLPNPVTSSLTLTVSNYANPYITFLIDY